VRRILVVRHRPTLGEGIVMQRTPTEHEAAFLSIIGYLYEQNPNKPHIGSDDVERNRVALGQISMTALSIGITLAHIDPDIAAKMVAEFAAAVAKEQGCDITTLLEGFADCAEMILDGNRI
jgi:hypothetical protein